MPCSPPRAALTPARLPRSYGPHDTTRGREYNARGVLECELKFAPFSGAARRAYQQDDEEKELSGMVAETLSHALRLELYPKARIELFINVLEDDGSGTVPGPRGRPPSSLNS